MSHQKSETVNRIDAYLLQEQSCQISPNLIRNNRALAFLKRSPQEEEHCYKMSSDMRSVRDLTINTGTLNTSGYAQINYSHFKVPYTGTATVIILDSIHKAT